MPIARYRASGVIGDVGRVERSREHGAGPDGRRQSSISEARAAMATSSAMTNASSIAEAALLKAQHDQHVEGGERDAEQERHVEQKLERDRGADHLGEIAGDDGDLAEQPQA